jgi:hypothetical protein
MGNVPPAPSRGVWDGDKIVLTSTSPQGVGRYTHRFEGEKVWEFILENSFDGGKTYKRFMSGLYKKVG